MNQFAQSTRSTINTIKAHALLSKALTNDPKPTPGYLFPDIARLTHSTGTCSIVLTQLLKAITPSGHAGSASVTSTHAQSFVGSAAAAAAGGPGSSGASSAYPSSPHVLLKALKILRQLAQSGSVEFRTLLARRGKALLVEMVGYKGPWDEVHGDRYNEDVRTVAEDLIEYMHANPVLEQEEQDGVTDLTDQEAAVLKSSTQDLQGFGHPDYEDSDSEDDTSRSKARVKSKKARKENVERATPPLPGFGNPAFEKDNPQAEPTLMSRLVDRIQEMTAPPPPVAMREAYRKQEQRRQKLFVGEYSMRDDTSGAYSRSKGDPVSLVGTNPFKRTTRTQGLAAGGWADKSGSRRDAASTRMFPLSRLGTGTIQFRNATSSAVYELAQHVQPGVVRTKLQSSESDIRSSGAGLLSVWGTAKDICDIVAEGVRKDASTADVKSPEENGMMQGVDQTVPTMTGLVRDITDWIEQEDWERRLRYLVVLDALLAYPETQGELLDCSAMPVLLKTLESSRCQEAPQRSIRDLAHHSDTTAFRILQKGSSQQIQSSSVHFSAW
ncbi:hypothetical protein BGZ70_002215 [Mortierella alpina]|uniref:Uncharacterized protein n=1 Tax=Mortierella alpina TaxID=64518 RepID=A0A9P6LX09_MORAP|nr:hypothetical protein BGZ70_002215 [Mortierella alpina]